MCYDIILLSKEKREKMDFTKFNCPVCNKNFVENDDVVVCPECGTPHHRECYKTTGKCFNENLHGTDIPVQENHKTPEAKKVEEIPVFKPEEKKEENTEKPLNTGLKGFPEFLKISPAQSSLIEGKHTTLFEAAVGKNQDYYIPKFMLMSSLSKGISLNFVAFFAPLAWALYRKMYKIAALIFAAYTLFFGLFFYNIYTDTEVIDCLKDCWEECRENPELYSQAQLLAYEESDVTLTQAQKNLTNAIAGVSHPMYLIVLSYVVSYAPKIGLGILGNKLYLKKLCKNIDKAEKKNLEGDKLKIYLYKKYGTLPLAIAIVVAVIELTMFR